IYDLIRRVRPRVTIWFHQHQDLVDISGGDPRLETRFAALVGLRARRLTRYGGSAPGWENHAIRSSTAFVVELPPGRPRRPAPAPPAAASLHRDLHGVDATVLALDVAHPHRVA